jgi:hypothetical protein
LQRSSNLIGMRDCLETVGVHRAARENGRRQRFMTARDLLKQDAALAEKELKAFEPRAHDRPSSSFRATGKKRSWRATSVAPCSTGIRQPTGSSTRRDGRHQPDGPSRVTRT